MYNNYDSPIHPLSRSRSFFQLSARKISRPHPSTRGHGAPLRRG